ncbi:conserved hypothetical protein [Beutenbergia cavernae DSM 12333]|uniref:Uncharacterized protein n=1 Tax=Beutenbergia cavernae (strain ATCC BAA-8 / DSM 12333 / CCUG 43141 / JCM 11478 / NBRC 16432 / NCIMB 13614 / HKI 0122) TaxID=471853 RepID=C5C235_BEUC1|nr:hypothetical protein [Beutenbergia cavernae]ACQ81660.1 conserved hypothetical protein [Beutenbergia cavernae DSM 12333]
MSALMGSSTRAVLTSLAATGLAVAAYLSWPGFVAAAGAATLIFAVGWAMLLGLPAARGTIVVLVGATLAAFGAVLVGGDLRYLAVVMALGVGAAFVHELARRDGRPRLVESLAGTVTGLAVVCSGAGWAALGPGVIEVALVLCAAIALAAASACTAIRLGPWREALITMGVTTVVGAVAGLALLTSIGALTGALVGLATGTLTAALHILLGRYPTAGRFPAGLAAAMLPIVVVGIPVYVVDRLFL